MTSIAALPSTKQKAALYDFAIANELLSAADLQREIASQLRSTQAATAQLEALLPEAAEEEPVAAPRARRTRTASTRRDAKKASKRRTAEAASVQPLSRKKKASRKLQGQYLALVRRFPAAARAKYSEIAKDEGREAAILLMKAELDRVDGL